MSNIPIIGGPAIADAVSRTDLLLGRRGAIRSLRDADAWFEQRPVQLSAGGDVRSTPDGQAALITVATLLRRAGFPVWTSEPADGDLLVGPYRGRALKDVLSSFGVRYADRGLSLPPAAREVLLGDVQPCLPSSVHLTWDGWVAAVRRPGDRLAERPGCRLAPLLAAALVVSEIMESHLGVLEAGWRDVTMSLWDPTSPEPLLAHGPALRWLPQSWMLVGLGHLGQANAWCISHLPYDDGTGELWLADDDLVTAANISTGILTESSTLTDAYGRPPRKTRVVADAVERAGRVTRLLESRLPTSARFHEGLPRILLVGVDNLDLRRALSDFNWPLAIDAGLGSTPSSFDSIALHAFDGAGVTSHDINAWADGPQPAVADHDGIFDDLRRSGLDECGIVTLASRKVACAYVGMIASSLAISEALRRTMTGPAVGSLSVVLDAHVIRGQQVTATNPRAPLIDAGPRQAAAPQDDAAV